MSREYDLPSTPPTHNIFVIQIPPRNERPARFNRAHSSVIDVPLLNSEFSTSGKKYLNKELFPLGICEYIAIGMQKRAFLDKIRLSVREILNSQRERLLASERN